jgi:hypothetical protein
MIHNTVIKKKRNSKALEMDAIEIDVTRNKTSAHNSISPQYDAMPLQRDSEYRETYTPMRQAR